jgi:hypothetical protein
VAGHTGITGIGSSQRIGDPQQVGRTSHDTFVSWQHITPLTELVKRPGTDIVRELQQSLHLGGLEIPHIQQAHDGLCNLLHGLALGGCLLLL